MQNFAFPYSALLAAVFLLSAFAVHRYAHDCALTDWLKSLRTARILLAIGAVLLAVEGTWSIPLHRSVVFVLYALVLLFTLALTVLDGLRRKASPAFLLSHAGIFLIVWAALFGAPDVVRAKMIVGQEVPVRAAYADDGLVVPLPFEVSLVQFQVEYYPDSISPRQFTSHLLVAGEPMTVAVNSPCSYQGYTFYQDSYDREAGRYTVLQVVRDPWLPLIYAGMLLLAVGSLLLLFGQWRAKFIVPAALLLTVLFTALTVAKINFGTLMPALRSWWFVPHLFIYMVAYSLMALALMRWLVEARKQEGHEHRMSNNLVRSSSALLVIGMLTGSVWARQAWGDYWAWDPKENWAAVTWLLTLVHLHLQSKRGWQAIALLILAFTALQVTWYGVNYLPSAIDSLHTYTG